MSGSFVKIVLPESYGFSDPIASLVPVHSKGIDSGWHEKRSAAEKFALFDDIKPKSGHSLIHLIAMGAADSYGSNRNGDAFFKNAVQLDLADSDWTTQTLANGKTHTKSAATFSDATSKGLLDTFDTFEKYAHVFKHHQNKASKGDRIWGAVKAAAYNKPMDRVELLIEVNNSEWRDDLQKLASGSDIPFSMACSLDPNIPVLTSTGYKPISQVAEGDMVLTHKNRFRKVTKTIKRRYSGRTVTLGVKGCPFKLSLTADHPLLAPLVKEKVIIDGKTMQPDMKKPGWVHAGHFELGDEIMSLAPWEMLGDQAIEKPAFAMFLAEALDGDKLSPEELEVAKKFLGTYLDQIYLGLFNSAQDCKLAFIAGLIDGPNATVDKDVIWLTVNPYLALQVHNLIGSAGLPSVINTVTAKDEKGEPVTAYEVRIPIRYCHELLDHSAVLNEEHTIDYVLEQTTEEAHHSDLYVPLEITSVDENHVSNEWVWNIEVEEDASYLMASIVSHNCKVPHDICSYCGHKAKNRGEYCSHLDKGLTDMLKTGHVVAAVNDHMAFFDISRVNRPADRIAWSLRKAASGELVRAADLALDPIYATFPDIDVLAVGQSDKVAQRLQTMKKLAEIEKRIGVSGTLAKWAPGMKHELDDSRCTSLAGRDKTATLRALSDANILLPLREFAALALGSSEKIATIVEEATPLLPQAFGQALLDDPAKVAANFAYDVDLLTPDRNYVKFAKDMQSALGLDPDALQSRTILNTLREYKPHVKSASTASPAATGLVKEYLAYKLSFLNKVAEQKPKDFELFSELCVVQNCVQ